MKRRRLPPTSTLFAASWVALVALTGCPLSDEYSVDANYGTGGTSKMSGGSGGALSSGGHSDAGQGGAMATSLGGRLGSGGGAPLAGASGDCTAASCTAACCSGLCADLRNDPNNCGQCGNVCSAGRACRVGACAGGWLPIAAPPAAFVPREKAAYAAFSGKLFVFGGLDADGKELDTSAIYDPALDTWQLGAIDSNTLSARELATAIWTGSTILVFGGRNQGGQTIRTDAAFYDPVANRWSKASSNATARAAPVAATADGSVLFWSGLSAALYPLGGADLYRVSTDTWSATSTANGPPRLGHASTASVGDAFYLYGGNDSTLTKNDKTYRYDFSSNSWTVLARGPSARAEAFGASDGARFYVWGGRDDNALKTDGGAYDTLWVPLGVSGAPSTRYAPPRESGWTFPLDGAGFVLLAGFDGAGSVLHDGGRYATATDDWSSILAWTSAEDHAFGAAAYIAGELVVFSGRSGSSVTNTGERYAF